MADYLIVVPGGLNTDIIGLGVEKLLGAGELTLGGELKIGPGGKARNMAQMAAAFLGKGKVAMIGRSSQDAFGLWKIPLRSLENAGVDTRHVKVLNFEDAGKKFPGIALIPVDRNGQNQIYVLPGVNADFCPADIDDAAALFRNPDRNKVMILALEIPIDTAKYAIDKAAENRIKVVLDPGGISKPVNELLNKHIYLIKPNEHETKILTGVSVTDFQSAKEAARGIMATGVQNVLITHGVNGGYLFNREREEHIPAPLVVDGVTPDETGCGDQVTAVLAAFLAEGKKLPEAARWAIIAGTLQFQRSGIQPVSKAELFDYKYLT